ncbi:hypothetical protein PMAC_000665 [Pneumocystis sp. 'macacae']|nr:hypothetical protein PMAC_000665 [Pneumocystis sp. 'macacae']
MDYKSGRNCIIAYTFNEGVSSFPHFRFIIKSVEKNSNFHPKNANSRKWKHLDFYDAPFYGSNREFFRSSRSEKNVLELMEKLQELVSAQSFEEEEQTIRILASYIKNTFDMKECMKISRVYCSIATELENGELNKLKKNCENKEDLCEKILKYLNEKCILIKNEQSEINSFTEENCLEQLKKCMQMGTVCETILDVACKKVQEECEKFNITIPSEDIPLPQLPDTDISSTDSNKNETAKDVAKADSVTTLPIEIYTGTGTVITHVTATVTADVSEIYTMLETVTSTITLCECHCSSQECTHTDPSDSPKQTSTEESSSSDFPSEPTKLPDPDGPSIPDKPEDSDESNESLGPEEPGESSESGKTEEPDKPPESEEPEKPEESGELPKPEEPDKSPESEKPNKSEEPSQSATGKEDCTVLKTVTVTPNPQKNPNHDKISIKNHGMHLNGLYKESNENLNSFKLEKKDYSAFVNDTLFNVLSKRSLSSSVWANVEHDPLVLIVASLDTFIKDQEECISFLEYLCQNLLNKLPEGGFTTILRALCESTTIYDLCKRLTTPDSSGLTLIQKKCHDLEKKLAELFNSNEELFLKGSNKRLAVQDCENYNTFCNIFYRICHGSLANLCGKLKYTCYLKRREDYRNTLVSTLIKDHLGNSPECVKELLLKCHCLVGLGPDMVESCLQIWKTCNSAVQTVYGFCPQLAFFIKKAFSGNSRFVSSYKYESSKNRCSLFGVCDYFILVCNDGQTKDLCIELKQECSKTIFTQSIEQTLTECSSDFGRVDLNSFFFRMRGNGDLFPHGKPYLSTLLLLLSSSMPHKTSLEERCTMFLTQYCTYYQTIFLNLDQYCSSGQTDECKMLDVKATESCNRLKAMFENLGFVSEDNSYMLLSGAVSDRITLPQCVLFLEECIYFGHACSNLKDLCKIILVICNELAVQRYNLNNVWMKFNKKLLLGDSGVPNIKHLLFSSNSLNTHILEICAEIGGFNEILYQWCLNPYDLIRKLYYYLLIAYEELMQSMLELKEFPSLSQCMYYLTECGNLDSFFDGLKDLCTKLRMQCFGTNHKDYFEDIEPIKLT